MDKQTLVVYSANMKSSSGLCIASCYCIVADNVNKQLVSKEISALS